MHVSKILHELLSGSIHQTRIKTLETLITGLLDGKALKLSALGRSLPTHKKERYGIQQVNRFLANRFFQEESIQLYQCITHYVVHQLRSPNILVDWSSLPNSHYINPAGEHCVLRASLAAEGRAVTLYEEVHPKSLEGNPLVHATFLTNLQSILPKGCTPCIITDAGFKTPWFKKIIALGWDYIGRLACGTSHFDDGGGYRSARELFQIATKTPTFIGSYILTKSNPLKTSFYLYKGRNKGRHKWTKTIPKKIAQDKDSRKHGKSYREPWILVSSLKGSCNARKIVKRYQFRMTIEENIRDTKSVKTGFSMNENLTIKTPRYIVWLILAALASLIAWIVGFAAELGNLHLNFQANSYRHRRVLSFFFLGCRIIKKKIIFPCDYKQIRQMAWGNST